MTPPTQPADNGWIARSLQLGALILAAAVLVIFLLSQNPNTGGYLPSKRFNSTVSGAQQAVGALPPVDELVARAKSDTFIRTPGAVAKVDEASVEKLLSELRSAATADNPVPQVRILIAPPGIPAEQIDTAEKAIAKELGDETIVVTVVGFSAGAFVTAEPTDLIGYRNVMAFGDVTEQVLAVTRYSVTRESYDAPSTDRTNWRQPTDAELAAVTATLAAGNVYAAPGATLTDVPGDGVFSTPPVVVALPMPTDDSPTSAPIPDYTAALAKKFPNRTILQITGNWVTQAGPETELSDVTTASFYGARWRVLTGRTFTQQGILNAFANQSATVRVSGIFGRPVPERPNDDVVLPALPWVFTVLVAGFVALSVRRGVDRPEYDGTEDSRRLRQLSGLAVELSGLIRDPRDASLTRALSALGAAQDAVEKKIPAAELLDTASDELDQAAVGARQPAYRPAEYLKGRD